MQTSARNVFAGKVISIIPGGLSDEVVLQLASGALIVAAITKTSVESTGVHVGLECYAVIEQGCVVLMTDARNYKLSTRNQFEGTVTQVVPGTVYSEVEMKTANDEVFVATVTTGNVKKMGLAEGKPVTAVFKAMHVILAIPK